MSELKRHHINEVMDMHNLTRGKMGYSFVYYADDVDKVIANRDYEIDRLKEFNAFLKQRISNGDVCRSIWLDDLEQKDKEIAELQAENAELKKKLENVQASMYCDVVDANMENRRLKRALYKACANWANLEVFDRTVGIDDPNVEANRWALMRNKCLKKVEEYK